MGAPYYISKGCEFIWQHLHEGLWQHKATSREPQGEAWKSVTLEGKCMQSLHLDQHIPTTLLQPQPASSCCFPGTAVQFSSALSWDWWCILCVCYSILFSILPQWDELWWENLIAGLLSIGRANMLWEEKSSKVEPVIQAKASQVVPQTENNHQTEFCKGNVSGTREMPV